MLHELAPLLPSAGLDENRVRGLRATPRPPHKPKWLASPNRGDAPTTGLMPGYAGCCSSLREAHREFRVDLEIGVLA